MTEKMIPPRPEVDMVACPACSTTVAKTAVDPTTVAAPSSDPEVARDIRERRISRAERRGFYDIAADLSVIADRQQRVAEEQEQPEPRAGLDICPACQSPDVAVNEAVLTPTGRRALQLSRSDGIDRARKVREEKSEVSQQMHKRNKRLREQRAAELAARGRMFGGTA